MSVRIRYVEREPLYGNDLVNQRDPLTAWDVETCEGEPLRRNDITHVREPFAQIDPIVLHENRMDREISRHQEVH